jgi:hypothetical protein
MPLKLRSLAQITRIAYCTALIVTSAHITGCTAMTSTPNNAATTAVQQHAPLLNLKTYFNGTIDAWGIVQDRSGKVIKRFNVVMKCHWIDNVGTLDEHFTYSDGTTQQRIWTLTQQPKNTLDQPEVTERYTGTAGDVVGQAAGEVTGNQFHWRYTMALPVDGTVYHVNFDDTMFLMTDDVMLNKATFSKWGFRLGEVTLSFKKRGSAS